MADMRTKAGWIAAGVLLLVVVIVGLLLYRAREAKRDLALKLDRAIAEQDTTRQVGDSWMRRAVQAEAQVTKLEDSLKLKPKVVVRTEIQFDTVEVGGSAPVTEVEGARIASWAGLYRAPVTANVNVVLPPPPNVGTIDLMVVVDPIPIETRVTCSEVRSDTTSIYSATVLVKGPPWARISIDSTAQDPDVCNKRMIVIDGPWNLLKHAVPTAGVLLGTVAALKLLKVF